MIMQNLMYALGQRYISAELIRSASRRWGAGMGHKATRMSLILASAFLLDAVVKRRFDGLMILERISGKVA
jgi:hypothetical protein